ncbi:hypothetical protein IWW55_000817 [Coemansia sp. RSA 2706]|nr:hypothetical protein LPJ63_003681 [Coemansia sp. RSA 2711]KAJ2306742.1 hypothetical protein IWW55_001309 [Coemansia sp. RSA 2706]KAJ2308002.1 hypothetical protein IWW54_004201 [Coemansia sp. RSA 2705]KAJ2315195.1 hypothetical protein IWW52_004094 [Coemansia sp. RSA 2704]KAJ2326542.1 hypothetical protein IWW51_002224 [Coemansia sp. RSA 2702]KAJ2368195.1 hypothetical protein H4S01_001729 [Coemansia sp. RSA 2610]KAJ2391845.1 hypothetical protein H4S02_001110 [Coemansia sp. RSA 2611]KAJ272620
MYYDYTPEEEERVEMGSFFDITIDPIGYGDLAMTIIWAFVLTVGLVAMIYTWVHRRYAPLKAKNIPLMTGIYLHSVFFFLGDLTMCGLVHVRGPFFANCTLMLVWFRSMFGNFALGSLLAIRSYKLYRVFCKNKPMHGYRRCIPYLLFLALILVVGIVSTVIPRGMTVDYIEGIEFCIVNQHLVTTYCVILWCVWSVYMGMVWLLRDIRSSFNEFREMAISLVLLVGCTIFNQVLLYDVPRLPTSLRWRLALVTVDQVTANFIWWLIMLKPLYNCVFRHDAYLAEWKEKMTFDGLRAQYGVGIMDTEMSSHSNTLVYGLSNSGKPAPSEPSYTESTRLAINQLAAYPLGNQPCLPATEGRKWDESSQANPGFQAGLEAFRRSNSQASSAGFERRRSEPFVSNSSADNAVAYATQVHERRSRQRMLEQRCLPHCNSTEPLRGSESNPHSILQVDRSQIAPITVPNTYGGRGSLDRHIPRPSVLPYEMQRWQHSDTDLSLISSGCSGGRRLL